MKKLKALSFMLIMSVGLLIGCGTDSNSTDNKETPQTNTATDVDFSEMIEVKGSDTMVNLGQRWAEEFMNQYTDSMVAVTGGGSGTGIAAIINNSADIAQSSRAMKDEEKEQAKANGIDLKEFVAGKDGIAIVVNKENKIESLTMENLKDIFTGNISNWKDLGGNDEKIVLYSRESNSGTYAFFKEFVLKDEEYAKHSLLMPSTGAIVEGIKQDKSGIGYIGLGYLNDEIKVIPISKEEGKTAILPSIETVNSGEYPVARELFLYTAGEPQGAVKLYMDYIMGTEGQKIVEELQFVPIK